MFFISPDPRDSGHNKEKEPGSNASGLEGSVREIDKKDRSEMEVPNIDKMLKVYRDRYPATQEIAGHIT